MDNASSLLSETTSSIERKPSPGQVAVVLTALVIGILLMAIQLWLLTIALELYLAERGAFLWLMAVISGLVFLGGLLMLHMLNRHPSSPRQLPPDR